MKRALVAPPVLQLLFGNQVFYVCFSTMPGFMNLSSIEGGGQLPSTGAYDLDLGNCQTSALFEKLQSSSTEDEVEMREFQNEGEFIQSHSRKVFLNGSDEETLSETKEKENNELLNFPLIPGAINFQKDSLRSFDSENQNGDNTWSAVLKEAEDLVYVRENAGCSSSHAANSATRKYQKGSGGKEKLKFSIRFQSCKGDGSRPSVMKDGYEKSSIITQVPAGLEALEHKSTENSMAELLEIFQGENEKVCKAPLVHGELEVIEHITAVHSMSELLEGFQEKNGALQETYNMNSNTKESRLQHAAKRTLSALGDRTLDNEDPLEPLDCGMSSEDEGNDQNQLSFATPKTNGQTMADRFQEVFSAAAVYDEGALFPISKHIGIGYYGRLQQIMQNEKDMHMEFLKQLQTGVSPHDEARCIDVQILSRYLDAKLTVCHCSIGENSKSSQGVKSPQKLVHGGGSRNRTIIFSPRICGNVELEVGNLIRIHPPWKEAKVLENEKIILCTYFSQV
ncbi:kinetochore protein isoform X2 [Tasmannia lanceolata]|uniref:kinetochore protein isoform X2 n=1 Tax=Tasmannia lanceolata TaxID=3420 RepID=UPI00406487D5